ncbi:hypothetical protein V8F06_009107 [Rhypophila decipiens]
MQPLPGPAAVALPSTTARSSTPVSPVTADDATGPRHDHIPSISATTEPTPAAESTSMGPRSPSPNPTEAELGRVIDDRPPPLPSRPQSAEMSSHSIGFTLGRFVLFHIPAITFTVLLLVVYILRLSWNPTANHLAGLLLGAKVHEALIVVSLFDIVYYHVRRALLSSRGVPLGYLTAPFRLNSPFHFFTRQFWAPFTSSIAIGLLLIISFLLAFLVGASSSVLVLPTAGWWPHPDSIGRIWFTVAASVPGLPGLVLAGKGLPRAMYPQAITHQLVPGHCRSPQTTDPSEMYVGGCPYDDFRRPQGGIYSWLGSTGSGQGLINLTLSLSESRSALLYDSLISDTIAVATTPLVQVHQLVNSAASRWAGHRGDEAVMVKPKMVNKNHQVLPFKQPLVLVQCADEPISPIYNKDGTAATASYEFRFVTKYYPGFNVTINRAVFAEDLRGGASFGFMNLRKGLPEGVFTSVAFWTRASPRSETLGLCILDTRWIEADAWITTQAGPSYRLGSYSPLQQSIDMIRNETLNSRRQDPGELVVLDPSWCDGLNASFVDPQAGDASSSVKFAFNMISQAAATAHSRLEHGLYTVHIARALAVYLANAMSTVPLAGGIQVESSRDGPWKPDPNYRNPSPLSFDVVDDLAEYLLITAEYFVHASAYTFGEISTMVAWAILLAHLLLVLVHFVVVLVFRGWYTRVAGSLGALLALAVESMPSGLGYGNEGGSLDAGIWKTRAYVRDAGPAGVEIILQDGVPGGSGKGVDRFV